VLAIDRALEGLAATDPEGARIVETRFFAGMTETEIAAVSGISKRWVRQQPCAGLAPPRARRTRSTGTPSWVL